MLRDVARHRRRANRQRGDVLQVGTEVTVSHQPCLVIDARRDDATGIVIGTARRDPGFIDAGDLSTGDVVAVERDAAVRTDFGDLATEIAMPLPRGHAVRVRDGKGIAEVVVLQACHGLVQRGEGIDLADQGILVVVFEEGRDAECVGGSAEVPARIEFVLPARA